ncbi:MAG: hypothetical protein MSA38_02360, partial [Bacteroidales bacterium]|nr:hypothetical protein [Bacteroidales bacterium]
SPSEDFHSYEAYGREMGIEVIEGPQPEECGLFEGKAVSSSLVRSLMEEGRRDEAHGLMKGRGKDNTDYRQV